MNLTSLFDLVVRNAQGEFMVDAIPESVEQEAHDAQVDKDRLEDEARIARQNEFCDVLDLYPTHEWFEAIARAWTMRRHADAFRPGDLAWHIANFVAADGWADCLRVMASLFAEQQREGRA